MIVLLIFIGVNYEKQFVVGHGISARVSIWWWRSSASHLNLSGLEIAVERESQRMSVNLFSDR